MHQILYYTEIVGVLDFHVKYNDLEYKLNVLSTVRTSYLLRTYVFADNGDANSHRDAVNSARTEFVSSANKQPND